jgi:hypothetical protein
MILLSESQFSKAIRLFANIKLDWLILSVKLNWLLSYNFYSSRLIELFSEYFDKLILMLFNEL